MSKRFVECPNEEPSGPEEFNGLTLPFFVRDFGTTPIETGRVRGTRPDRRGTLTR